MKASNHTANNIQQAGLITSASATLKRLTQNYTFLDYTTQAYILLIGLITVLWNSKIGKFWYLLLLLHILLFSLAHLLIVNQSKFPKGSLFEFLRLYYPIPLYIVFYRETGILNQIFIIGYLDPFFIRLEEWLFGCQPSLVWMQKLPYIWVSELFYISYFSYYLMIAGVGLWLFLRNKEHFQHFVSLVSFIFYICFTIYIFVPVVGPRIFYKEIVEFALPADLSPANVPVFPESVKAGIFYNIMAVIYLCFESPGAAFPSSHVAIALTTVYFSFKYLPKIRYFHLVLALMLCLSTVYCRYHYLVDVFAGALTTAILLPIGNKLFLKFKNNSAN